MALKRINKIAALAIAAIMASEAGLTSFVPLTAEAKESTASYETKATVNSSETDNFTWDNATVYFVLTDRFWNGDKSNDHSYGRSVGEEDADNYENRVGTFHGGDLAGMTQKIEEGYFDDLGVNAIWITAPYEQIHGAMCAAGYKHYPYHGYWALDFSNMDANMGTEEEMKTFVDTAHEHGIRVVLDVVMNHVGYADPVTAEEYGFGKLSSNWKDVYYNTSESQYKWYHDYDSETQDGKSTMVANGDWVTNWWGPNWVRALGNRLNGYQGSESGEELTLCTDGLPDIKTENTSDVGLPKILENKWKKEGRYEEEMTELNKFFSDNSLPKSQANYVVKWLTDYVREYGVDGFRCDTAKHVEISNWKTLKDQANKALKEWRANNPDNVAASWDEDFWMTGEVFGYSGGKNDYFTSGAFDSLINFAFQGKENTSGAGLESIYSGYASSINNDPNYNMLTYISSHDTSLGARSANAGTALLLAPGGVQIFYGDETGRKAGTGDGKQPTRSHMNWNSIDTKIQSNWQKVGKFRRNHASVGAGQHKQLSSSPYTFSRTYHVGEADEDKVVVSLPGTAGTHSVSVGDVFADGETVIDAYSGESYQVSGGSVSVTCDDNGVILLEGSGEIKPSIGGKIVDGTYSGTTYMSETIDVKLSMNKVKDATYSINGGAETPFNADDVITIGGGTAYEEKVVLVLKGKSEEDNTEVTKTITYQKCTEPSVSDGKFCIKAKKSDFPTAPDVYIWEEGAEPENKPAGSWPGTQMTADADSNYWSYSNDTVTGEMSIIISLGATESSAGTWRTTPEGAAPLAAKGTMELDKASKTLKEMEAGVPARVNVKYVDENGTELKTGVYRVGAVGNDYATSAAVIKDYTLKETPDNATGKFTEDAITVTYVYSSNNGPITPTVTDVPTPTVTDVPEPTVTDIPEPTVTDVPNPTVTDVPEPTVTDVPDPTPTDIPGDFKMEGFVAVKTASGIKLIASAIGGTGTVRYMFTCEKNGKEILIQNFSKESTSIWVPAETGEYKLNVYAVNNGRIIDKDIKTYTVR